MALEVFEVCVCLFFDFHLIAKVCELLGQKVVVNFQCHAHSFTVRLIVQYFLCIAVRLTFFFLFVFCTRCGVCFVINFIIIFIIIK